MLGASTEDLQKLVLTIGGGGVVGYFIANKYNKSKTLGVVLGIGATLGSLYVYRIYQKNERNKRMINEGLLPKLNVNTIQKDSLGMPILKDNTIEENRIQAINFFKTKPDNFTIKLDSERNVKYTKNSNLEFYKTPYTINGFSGVQPIKIGGAEFLDAYNKFLQQPK